MVSVLSGALINIPKIGVPKSDFVKAFEDLSHQRTKPKRVVVGGPAARARFTPKPP